MKVIELPKLAQQIAKEILVLLNVGLYNVPLIGICITLVG
jgi:hypothetical protein